VGKTCTIDNPLAPKIQQEQGSISIDASGDGKEPDPGEGACVRQAEFKLLKIN